MIEIKKITQPESFATLEQDEQMYAAFEDGEVTGFCKYKLEGDTVVLLELSERGGDLLLADGIARTAIASFRGSAQRVRCQENGLLPAFMNKAGCYDDNREAPLERALRGNCAAQGEEGEDAE